MMVSKHCVTLTEKETKKEHGIFDLVQNTVMKNKWYTADINMKIKEDWLARLIFLIIYAS